MTRLRKAQVASTAALVVVVLAALFAATTPDLSDLPAYECVPGDHHTTKECDQ